MTHDFACAAVSVAPSKTNVWIAKRASLDSHGKPDGVSIRVRADPNSKEGQKDLSRIERALEAVATRHQLTEDPVKSNGNKVILAFRRSGTVTHEVEIAMFTEAQIAVRGQARLAIILDDLGNDPAAANAVFSLPYPLTVSILPNHAHSAEIAEEAHRRGFEVMLHLPMEAIGSEKPEAEELRPGMSAEEVRKVTDEMIDGVPYAEGVNNHQGSEATSDAALMEELMPVLRERGLFYIDSRTTAATVAYETAKKDDVGTAFRNVPFLDDVEDLGAIRRQLQLAIHGAREKGEAIAIGHPHKATIEALSEMLPKAQAEGVRLVHASDLVH